jgi:hypothetical protein
MFYLLKHLLLLNLVMFKLKSNNLTFNEILILNALFVCLLHSCFIEDHPIWILEYEPLISEVVLSRLCGDFLVASFPHPQQKHKKLGNK